jgi:hypothetical protein
MRRIEMGMDKIQLAANELCALIYKMGKMDPAGARDHALAAIRKIADIAEELRCGPPSPYDEAAIDKYLKQFSSVFDS